MGSYLPLVGLSLRKHKKEKHILNLLSCMSRPVVDRQAEDDGHGGGQRQAVILEDCADHIHGHNLSVLTVRVNTEIISRGLFSLKC